MDGELYHYGIKGMKWGIRRYQNLDGSRTPLGKQRERKGGIKDKVSSRKEEYISRREYNKERARASRNRHRLPEEELDKRIRRLEKEKRLRELTEQEVQPGRTAVKKFLTRHGEKIVSAAIGIGVGATAAAVAYQLGMKVPGAAVPAMEVAEEFVRAAVKR